MPINAPSVVMAVSPAAAAETIGHYATLLSLETDCADVNSAFRSETVDFVLLDVRSTRAFEAGHVAGATNLPTASIDETTLSSYPSDTTFVVYCAGPHCNGADKAALRLAELGRPVKKMIGGVTGWLDEGLTLTGQPAEASA